MFGRIKTISNVRHVAKGLYKVNYFADYKLDELLCQGVKSVEELALFVSKKLLQLSG